MSEIAETSPSSKEANARDRNKRKEEGKLRKRQKIEESGGVRPRNQEQKGDQNGHHHNNNKNKKPKKSSKLQQQYVSQHRFGQVMEKVPCRNRPRFSTLSIALPGSVLSNCQTRELKTHLVGQIARACTLYHVDEIVVFDDKLAKGKKDEGSKDRSCAFLARVLQYCECPQYLRRSFFPRHGDLQFAGLLPPIDAPHHVRAEDRSKYREGVVLEPTQKEAKVSLVDCGIRGRPIEIDRILPVGFRCTVQFDPKDYGRPGKKMTGKVVSPSTPREDNGTYWGYAIRIADSIHKVFDECPFDGGYDLKIGTSERGDSNVEDPTFALPKFRHSLIVFGGVAGIEECVDADETCKLPGAESKKLFDFWVNTCPFQGSRTVRTEEAVLISLAKLSPHIAAKSMSKDPDANVNKSSGTQTAVVDLPDEAISEESSSSDSESD